MSIQRFYLAVQHLDLGVANWDTLIATMQAKGASNHDPNACNRNHWRPSLDESIWIFEALFDTDNVDVQWFIDWLANEFSVVPADIGESTGYNQYGRFSTFSYPDGVANRFRVGIFGFVDGVGWPSYQDSHAAVLQYIADNVTEWETGE